MTVTTTVEITDERIRGLLCCAFEGGIAYWGTVSKYRYAEGTDPKQYLEGGCFQVEEYWPRYCLLPLLDGCGVLVDNDDAHGPKDGVWLDRAAIQRGLDLMASNKPGLAHHWHNFMTENDDAETGDVFLQLCLYGEVIFG